MLLVEGGKKRLDDVVDDLQQEIVSLRQQLEEAEKKYVSFKSLHFFLVSRYCARSILSFGSSLMVENMFGKAGTEFGGEQQQRSEMRASVADLQECCFMKFIDFVIATCVTKRLNSDKTSKGLKSQCLYGVW